MDRRNWPERAVERLECANCGKFAYSDTFAPPRESAEFERWVISIWEFGRVQKTKIGFYVWCSPQCEAVWKRGHESSLNYVDGWAHGHEIEMDRRRIKSGVL